MGFETIATMVHLLSTAIVGSDYQESLLIDELNKVFRFDHNIFFMDASVEIDRFVDSTYHTIYTTQSLFKIENSLSEVGPFKNKTGKNELLIVCPGNLEFENVLRVMSFVKDNQELNVNLKIGIFFSHNISRNDLYQFFRWCWDHRIIYIFAAFRQSSSESSPLNIFNYNPFGSFDVINVTGSKSLQRIFVEKISNFHQHSFRIAVIANDSLVQYSSTVAFANGPDEMLWQTVFSVINATYSVFLVNASLDPVHVLDNGTVDIHGDLTDILNQRIITIYPMVMEILSMVFPKPKAYGTFEAYMKISTTSNLIGYSLLTITVVVFVLTTSRYVNNRKFLLIQCIVDAMNLLLNDNSAIKYQRMSFSEIALAVPMTFIGFIIVNGFLSSLKSQFTQPMMQPRIETIEEFYRSPLQMTSPNEYWLSKDAEMLNSLLKHEGNFSLKMRVIDYEKFVQQIIAEVTFSFAEYNSIAKFMCKHKKYYISPIQMQRIWYSHNLRHDFPFIDRINDIINRIKTAGLYEKWWRDATVEDKVFRNGTTEQAHGDTFSTPIFIVYGWIVGGVVFVIEVNWKKFKRIRIKFMKK